MRNIFILLFLISSRLLGQSPSILDIVVIGKDTIVASTHDMRIIVSHDGGKTWKTTQNELMKQLGLDGKRIWGIDSWIGIHERSYSRLFYSDDIGKTWKQIELNTDLFFAMEFIEVADKLWIVDDRGNLWEHKITNVETSLSWKKRTSFQDDGRQFLSTAHQHFYLRTGIDSISLFNSQTRKSISISNPVKYIRSVYLKDANTAFTLDMNGLLNKLDLRTKLVVSINKVEGYKWFNSLLFIEGRFYILGLLDDGKQENAVLTMLDSKFEPKRIEGLKGLDQDVCFIDKYKRIWIGTTKGMFVLELGSDRCKQIL